MGVCFDDQPYEVLECKSKVECLRRLQVDKDLIVTSCRIVSRGNIPMFYYLTRGSSLCTWYEQGSGQPAFCRLTRPDKSLDSLQRIFVHGVDSLGDSLFLLLPQSPVRVLPQLHEIERLGAGAKPWPDIF